MKKAKVRLKGRLKTYMETFIYLGFVLVLTNIVIYVTSGLEPGLIVSFLQPYICWQ